MRNPHGHLKNGGDCNTGRRCAECCELIPTGSGHDIDTREAGAVLYHFCGPQCYDRWLERSANKTDLG